MSPASPLPPLAAALLAGGSSTRMGRDKACIMVGGQPLWQLQLAKLRALEPAELFISGRPDGPYTDSGIEIVPDAERDLGPLAGFAALLRRATSPLVLVLAIDLPALSADFLSVLATRSRRSGAGLVPQNESWFEPLAAIYPRAALPLVEQFLREADRSLQRVVRELITAGLASALPLTAAQVVQFRNVNTPGDLSS